MYGSQCGGYDLRTYIFTKKKKNRNEQNYTQFFNYAIVLNYIILILQYDIGAEHNYFGALPDWVPRRISGSRWHMESERGEKSGCGNHCVRRVHWVFHLHRRDSDIVRIRVQPSEENASGEWQTSVVYIFENFIFVYKNGRYMYILIGDQMAVLNLIKVTLIDPIASRECHRVITIFRKTRFK